MYGSFTTIDLRPNLIEIERQHMAATTGYIDLTSSNPTHQGLLFPHAILQKAAAPYWATRRYEPNPHGYMAARSALVQYYAQRTPPLVVKEESIYTTASTSEAYGLLFALLTGPGDNVLAPNITYPLFEYLAEIHHITLKTYHIEEKGGWHIDTNSLLKQADSHTRAVLIVSPHNPTGMVLKSPLAALEQLGLPIICDEVFAAFPYQVPTVPPLATLHPNLPVFHLNGISKLFALPDLKLGWIALNAVAQNHYGDRLELLNDTFLGANSLIQTMLPTLFEQGMKFVATMQGHIRTNLDYAVARCAACPAMVVHPPDGGYYLFPSISPWDDEEELVLLLLKHGVLVHPGYFYGDVDGVHMMISALTEHATFVEGVELLCNTLDRFSRHGNF